MTESFTRFENYQNVKVWDHEHEPRSLSPATSRSHAHESRPRFLSDHGHVPYQSAGKSSKVTPISARLHLRVKRLERSEAVEPFDRTQGRLFERIERAAVLNRAPIRDVATSTLPVSRGPGPFVPRSRILTENGLKKVEM